MSNFVNTYLNSPSLLLYQPKVEVTDERNEEHSFLSRNYNRPIFYVHIYINIIKKSKLIYRTKEKTIASN